MPKLWRSILARRVITDRESNTASYIDSVEVFAVPSVPYKFPPVFLSTVWRRLEDDDKLIARVRIKGPGGAVLFAFEFPELAMATDLHRYNLQLGGFKIESAGPHSAVVEQRASDRWKAVASLPFEIELLENSSANKSKPAAKAQTSSKKPTRRSLPAAGARSR